MNEKPGLGELQELIENFACRAHEELEHRLGKWTLDLAENDFHEVVGALLARQVTLACQIAACPQIWNPHVAPLVLRAMADVYITVGWLLKEPSDRSKKFIHHGLGQEKLRLEHLRAQLEAREPREGEKEYLEAIEAWIDSQRATFLTDVNLGSWSGISTRAMAEDADCLDFYNHVYTPFSGCVHSMWQHVALYNLADCQNPLHGLHRIPAVVTAPLDIEYVCLAAEYLQDTFAKFDSVVGITAELESALDVLNRGIEHLGTSASNSQPESDRTSPT